MKIGITGHQELDDETAWAWVERQMREIVSSEPRPVIGISSLAVGADQLFARVILELGGNLHAVIPFDGYETKFDEGESRKDYLKLLEQATRSETLSARSTDEESYFAAGKRVVKLCDFLIAVWDGEKAAGLGGTGDAVEFARKNNKKIVHLDPVKRRMKTI